MLGRGWSWAPLLLLRFLLGAAEGGELRGGGVGGVSLREKLGEQVDYKLLPEDGT